MNMYILITILISNTTTQLSKVHFNTEIDCLKAINKLIDIEKDVNKKSRDHDLKFKSFCLKK